MENSEEENLRKNLWQQKQLHGNLNHIPQFYANQHATNFDMHHEMNQQPTSASATAANNNPTENMQFLYDNRGPYLKIYFPENITNDYDLFDRNQNDLPNFSSTIDGVNNFIPNTQNSLPFQHVHHQPQVTMKPPAPPTNVIHHLVSSLGPNKTGSYSPFGETIVNNSSMSSVEIPSVPENIVAPQQSPIQNNSTVNNVKKRIVAEVKPMRMSYSDVVSKNGVNQSPTATTSVGNTNSASSSPNTTLPVTSKSLKNEKTKFSNFDKKLQEDKAKKSPINTNNGSNNNVSSSVPNVDRKSPTTTSNSSKSSSTTPLIQQHKKKFHATSKTPLNNTTTNKKGKFESDSDDDDSSTIDSDGELEDDPMEYYNVRSYHNIEKISSKNNPTNIYKKAKTTQKEPTTASRKTDKTQKRSGKSSNRKRQKHEVLLKLCMAWMEYLLKFIKWLGILIYDVLYLSCGIIWDRMSWCYQCTYEGLASVRNELSANPGKSAWLWMKNNWKRFDAKFDKKSKWAFWRWMFKRKSNNPDNSKENFKDGKLPKTAEEAMKSLLNCKGKDAYSILGVSSTCSQEQIRKHYKKIAVLVHPDKNKQPGAEEAFKVLQRSFELIGEPESRQQYDRSMAEALHAEKAFSELNDLLIQLQTKISEAANTIRCSSCCFRHPRKPTGRKPFAARECSACKIRHPAREGDIWAETTMFGFRWKYLALMEGNVYDITQWALCQRGALSHLQPNSCVVQYKIVLGGNQQQQSHEKIKKDSQAPEPNMDDFFLNNIYAGQNPQQQQQQQQQHQASRRRFKKN